MIFLLSEHIITPLGEGADANIRALRQGKTALRFHANVHGETLSTPVMASLLEDDIYVQSPYTWFESLCIHTIQCALNKIPNFPVASPRCVLILSSTKGDIWCSMYETASHIAQAVGLTTQSIVVSTACTSGVTAQILAQRLIDSGLYDSAIVVGTDIQRAFIVSGFSSFHALSEQRCRPFDVRRNGLNAGEAVACMILSRNTLTQQSWQLVGGSIHNDANHISGPSRTAEGCLRCLQDMLNYVDPSDIAQISVHGTATVYNDEMESIAIHRAGLDQIPVSALKGYYGHTMGAAGLLETILSLRALEQHTILPTMGYEEVGTTYPLKLSNQARTTEQSSMIKVLSGFGGVNAAVAWKWGATTTITSENSFVPVHCTTSTIAEQSISSPVNLHAIYKSRSINYPKFYKMDMLSQLGFIAVEELLKQVRQEKPDFHFDPEKTAIVMANYSASLHTDLAYQETIKDPNNYYPSPALFVYTLPNVVTGELAIRHSIFGETACYILSKEEDLAPIVQSTLLSTTYSYLLVCWLECDAKAELHAHIRLLNKHMI